MKDKNRKSLGSINIDGKQVDNMPGDYVWEKSMGVYKDPQGIFTDTTVYNPQKSYNAAFNTPSGNMAGLNSDGNQKNNSSEDMSWEKSNGVYVDPASTLNTKNSNFYEVDLKNDNSSGIGMPNQKVCGPDCMY